MGAVGLLETGSWVEAALKSCLNLCKDRSQSLPRPRGSTGTKNVHDDSTRLLANASICSRAKRQTVQLTGTF